MIDQRFSAEAFTGCGVDTSRSRDLADKLEREITLEMREMIETRFREIVKNLSAMGHRLELYDEPSAGAISYRDDDEGAEPYLCRLRVAFDYVASAGYSHLSESEEISN